MSVYKEAFYALAQIEKASKQIFPDAADFGAPTKQGDALWSLAGMLAKYGILDSDDKPIREEYRYATGRSVTIVVNLLDEWNTGKEVSYRLEFVSCTTGACKGYDGFLWVYPVDRLSSDLLEHFSNKSKQTVAYLAKR